MVEVPAAATRYYNFIRLRASHTGLRVPIFISYRTRTGFDLELAEDYADKVLLHAYIGGMAANFDTTSPVLMFILNATGDVWRSPNVTVTFVSRPRRDVALLRIDRRMY